MNSAPPNEGLLEQQPAVHLQSIRNANLLKSWEEWDSEMQGLLQQLPADAGLCTGAGQQPAGKLLTVPLCQLPQHNAETWRASRKLICTY